MHGGHRIGGTKNAAREGDALNAAGGQIGDVGGCDAAYGYQGGGDVVLGHLLQ